MYGDVHHSGHGDMVMNGWQYWYDLAYVHVRVWNVYSMVHCEVSSVHHIVLRHPSQIDT